MKIKLIDIIDFEKINVLLEGFNKTTGFVTAILDLDGNILSKSGWRQICTEFHRAHPETSKKCTVADTVLAEKMNTGEKYYFYKCLNVLVDVAVPIIINGEHIGNLFSGQFFLGPPDKDFFIKQADVYGFNKKAYLSALEKVPIVTEEKVKTAMEFLLNITEMIVEMTQQKLAQVELNNELKKNDKYFRSIFTAMSEGFSILDVIYDESGNPCDFRFVDVNPAFEPQTGLKIGDVLGHTLLELFPTSEHYWIERFGKVELMGEPESFEAMFGPLNTHFRVNAFQTKPGQIGTMFTNINEHKLAEIMLRDEKEQKRAILELIGDPIFLKDKDHRIRFANPAFFDLFGLDEKNVIGETLAEIVPENERAQFLEVDRNVLETGISDYREEELTVGGQTHIIKTRKTRFIDEFGNKFLVGSIHNITESKMAEKKLKENEQMFSSIFDAVGDVIYMLNVEAEDQFRFISVNNSFVKVTGLPEEMILGKMVNEVIPKASLPHVLNEYRMAIKTKSLRRWEETSVYPNGRLVGDVSIVPIYDDKGNCTHLVGSVHDITDRKNSEEALKETAANLKSMIDNRTDSIWSIDRNYNYIIFNSTYKNIIKNLHNIELKKGMNAAKLLTDEAAKFWIPKFESVFAGESITFEFTHLLNGEIRHFRTSLNPIVEDHNVIGASGLSIDITEQKQTEVKLIDYSNRLSITLESISDAFVALDNDWCYTYMNKKAGEIFNRDPKAMIGKHIWTEFPEGIGQPFHKNYEKAMKERVNIKFEDYYPPYDKWFENRVNPTEDGIAIFFTDITDRKKKEEDIQKLNEDLEKRVADRTEDLNNSQSALLNLVEDLNEKSIELDKSARLLEAKNKELETFTYSVSHDLKAPLRGIDGYSKLLLDLHEPNLNEEAQTFIKTIRSATLQMNQLIDDLLEYSRLERSELRIDRVKLKSLIQSVLSIYNNQLEAANFNLNINIADIEISADIKGLTIAVRNLVENAIKFTKAEAEPSIQIKVEENDSSWIISVSDNGIGFDMKYHHKIFDIFQRLQRVEDYPGTGIGLAMVSKAMQRMNAKVWAESTVGIGSTFYLEISKHQ